MAFDIVARYEALFRAAGFHPGEVTTSSLAALNLYRGEGVAVVAKLSGQVLTVTVLSGNTIKLFRCVKLEGMDGGLSCWRFCIRRLRMSKMSWHRRCGS